MNIPERSGQRVATGTHGTSPCVYNFTFTGSTREAYTTKV